MNIKMHYRVTNKFSDSMNEEFSSDLIYIAWNLYWCSLKNKKKLENNDFSST